MPTYSYRCETCEHQFDLKQGFDAESVHPCPNCENTARRVFFPVGVIYKGSGFYTTDYKRAADSGSKSNSRSSNGSSSSSNDSSTSSESTSASTPSSPESTSTASSASD